MARNVEPTDSMRMAMTALAILLAVPGCASDDDDDDGGEGGAIECPAQAEVCGYRDGGWDAFCDSGVVSVRSYNTTLYCRPGSSSEILCESEPPPVMTVHTCAGGCATTDGVYLETVDEYQAFDPAQLCE